MAVNPITSESLTVDFKRLMSIPVGDRVRAASVDQNFVQSILTALTPIQIARAFPDYFRRQLPDISNFVTSNIVARNGGVFNQTGGGDQGYVPDYYDGETKIGGRRPLGAPEPTIQEMKEKLLKNGIDVDNVYATVSQGAILDSDDRIAFMKNLPDDELAKMGFQRKQDENGKTLIELAPLPSANLTDEQLIIEMKKEAANKEGTYRPVYPLSNMDLSPEVINTIAGEALYNKESIDGVINNMLNRVGAEKNWTNLKDVARAPGQYAGYKNATEEQAEVIRARIKEIASGKVQSNIGAATEFRAEYYVKGEGYGKTFEREARKQGYLQPGPGDNIYAETFAAGPYAPRTKEDVEKIKLENAAKINKSYTSEEVKKFREERLAKEAELAKEKIIRNLYNQASPTSSESAIVSGQTIVTESQSEVARVRKDPITPELKEVLQYAGEESGVEVQVFSGGQADITQGGDRTGSERHDLGHAADITLRVRDEAGNYRTLDSRNPQDQEIMANFIKNARRMGAKGIGHGLDYMGASAIHVGTVDRPDIDYSKSEYGAPAGKEAVWRSPDWVTNAFHQGQKEAEDFDMKAYREAREQRLQTQQAQLDQPVPQRVLGGNIYGVNEDITLVNTKTGEPIAQVNDNERIEKQGNAIQVTPETKLKADELTQKYDTSSEIEDRMNNIENRVDQQQEIATQNIRKATAPEKVQTESPMKWREAVAAGERPVSPSFSRAMARTKFFPEGHHFNRSSPSSQS